MRLRCRREDARSLGGSGTGSTSRSSWTRRSRPCSRANRKPGPQDLWSSRTSRRHVRLLARPFSPPTSGPVKGRRSRAGWHRQRARWRLCRPRPTSRTTATLRVVEGPRQ